MGSTRNQGVLANKRRKKEEEEEEEKKREYQQGGSLSTTVLLLTFVFSTCIDVCVTKSFQVGI